MAIGQFDILDAYWVAGTNPTTQVFSTAAGVEDFVANNAAAYQTWLAAGNFGTLRAITAESAGTAGTVRLTLDASQLQTGQCAQFAGLTGSPLANGFRQFNLIDATHIDLVGTTFVATASPTAATLAMAAILATDAALWAVFDGYAQVAFRQGAAFLSTSVDLTLTSPLKALTVITETGVSKKVILPNMRSPRAPPMGYTFSVKNGDSSTKSFTLYKNDGLTSIRLLQIGDRLNLVLTDNATINGTFEIDPPLTGVTNAPWTSYTPTVLSSTGTITTIDPNKNVRYKQIGRTVLLSGFFTITTNGAGAGYITVSLPVAGAAAVNGGIGMEGIGARLGATVDALRIGVDAAANTTLFIQLSNGTYPGANGYNYFFSIAYET